MISQSLTRSYLSCCSFSSSFFTFSFLFIIFSDLPVMQYKIHCIFIAPLVFVCFVFFFAVLSKCSENENPYIKNY